MATSRCRGDAELRQNFSWQLRSRMTPAEQALWETLRGNRLNGLRFRQQHPVGKFVLDFYCSHSKLTVEFDGGVHDAQVEQDAVRTAYLGTYGYRMIRFRNEDVLNDLPAVLEQIADFAHSGSPIIGG